MKGHAKVVTASTVAPVLPALDTLLQTKRRVSTTKNLALAALLVPLLVALPAQNVSTGEVRVSSRPWQPTQIFHSESVQVEVGVVVRNKKGEVVPGLKPQDFTVYDDGRKQELSGFAVLTRVPRQGPPTQAKQAGTATQNPTPAGPTAAPTPARPRFVALYFDDFHISPGDMRHVQDAAENFIRTGLSSGDKVGLFTASGAGDVNFTTDSSRVLEAVSGLKSHLRVFGGGGCPRITVYDAYLIANNLDPTAFNAAVEEATQCSCPDEGTYASGCREMVEDSIRDKARAIWEPTLELSQQTLSSLGTVVDDLAKMPGERVLMMASSGFYTETLRETTQAIVDAALRSGIVINAIDARGLFTSLPAHWRAQSEEINAASEAAVMRVTREAEMFGPQVLMSRNAMIDFVLGTGGRFFRDRNDIGAGYYTLAAAPVIEYLLTFTPQQLDNKYHKLQVSVAAPGSPEVQARPGYFATKAEATESASAESRLDKVVLSSQNLSEFTSSTNYQLRHSPSGTIALSVAFHVDLKGLPIVQRDGRTVEQLTFVAALFEPNEGFVVGKEGEMDLALKPSTYERFSKEGIDATMVLPVQPGKYRLRTVVEEGLKGRIVSRSEQVEVK
jgi:VWFA-related protein